MVEQNNTTEEIPSCTQFTMLILVANEV